MKPLYGRRRAALMTALAVVLIAAVLVPAGMADPPGTFAAPGLRVTPPRLEFGAVAPGETRERTVSITNAGIEPAQFSVMGVDTGFPQFNWNFSNFLDACPLSGPAVPVFLMPGQTCKLTVIAQPGSPGDQEGVFRIGETLTGEPLALIPLAVKAK